MTRAALRAALHAALAVLLAYALAWAGVAVASARGGAAGTVVICTGAGVLAVPADAGGPPAGGAKACPDGTLGFAATDVGLPAPRPPLRLAWTAPAAPAVRPAPPSPILAREPTARA